jgi:hypothetical protein
MNPALTADGVEADLKKIDEVGRRKQDLILMAALVGVGGLIAAVAVGFHSADVARGADAMTAPAPSGAAYVVPRATRP